METQQLLAQQLAEEHPDDAVAVLENCTPEEAARFLEGLPPRVAAHLLCRAVTTHAAACLTHLTPERLAPVLAALPLDRAAVLVRHLDPEAREPLLARAPTDTASLLRRLLAYPAGSAGALMDPRVLTLPEDISASDALARVRRFPQYALYYLYIVDRDQKLIGVLNLRELMLTAPRDMLGSVMKRRVVTISPMADGTAIREHSGWLEVHALPVVQEDGVLLGVLRYETLRQLGEKREPPAPARGVLSTVLTLGELYWIGLAGLMTDLTETAVSRKEREHG